MIKPIIIKFGFLIAVFITNHADAVISKPIEAKNPAVPNNTQHSIQQKNTSGASVPGLIEAENFDSNNGIQTEETTDSGGGQNIGYIDGGDFTEYTIDVEKSATYRVDLRVASNSNGGNVNFLADGVAVGAASVPGTGGWQNWITITTKIALAEGRQVFRLAYEGGNSLFNINWIRLTEDNADNPSPPLVESGLSTSPPPAISVERVFPNLNFVEPIAMLQAPGDESRWYVLEKSGTLYWIDANDNTTTEKNIYIDLTAVVDDENEGGLLGMAFHPNYAVNRQVFLSITEPSTVMKSVILRYTENNRGDRLNPDSRKTLLSLEQPFKNHNGGQLAFGPDGYLYVGFGDGGDANDPEANSQNNQNLHGSMIRIDVNSAQPYAIPTDNPFVNAEGRDEIYAYGLRNPWRWSFDAKTGLLWLGDVGQAALEEIDVVVKGGNYGWRCKEGTQTTSNPCGDTGPYIDPILEYGHNEGASVVGGYVYRGSQISALEGIYVFADFVNGKVWGMHETDVGAFEKTLLADTDAFISSFAQANNGELYLIDFQGGLYQIVQRKARPQNAFTRHILPGVIQAEDYDTGGEGIAYGDTSEGNEGGQYRSDDVDIENTSDTDGGHNVGWIIDGEWLEYTLASIESGAYDIHFRVAADGREGGKAIHATLDGEDLGHVRFEGTGGWQNWVTVSLTNVNISDGTDKVLRLNMIGGDFNLNRIEFTPFDSGDQGVAIYNAQCASCHGAKGEGTSVGVALNARQDLAAMIAFIEAEMPQGDTAACDSECAQQVARYIETFWPPVTTEEIPGPRQLSLLSRYEYNNTVNTLLGLSLDVTQNFPIEADVNGYDNNAQKNVVTGRHIDAQMAAASVLATQAVAQNKSLLLSCDPASSGCRQQFIAEFGQRAFRRPLSLEEIVVYEDVFNTQNAFEDGMRLVIRSMLASPMFLYKSEMGLLEGEDYRLTPYEVASVLSYMFWGTMPDAELFTAAANNALTTPAQLRAQATRLLADERAKSHMAHFAAQWLGADRDDIGSKDPMVYPTFSDRVRDAMSAELTAFFNHVMFDSSQRLHELFAANYVFVNETLANYYGIASVTGDHLRKVPDNSGNLGGVLTLGAVMAAHGHANESAPTI